MQQVNPEVGIITTEKLLFMINLIIQELVGESWETNYKEKCGLFSLS